MASYSPALFLSFAFLTLTQPPVLVAETLHVPAEFASIQSAVDASSPGDTVLVAPGTYSEKIRIVEKGIVLTSSHGVDVTILTDPQGAPTDTTMIWLEGTPPGTEVSGFTMTGVTDSARFGGAIGSMACSTLIKNNVFLENYAQWGSGIYLIGESRARIESNLFLRNRAFSGGAGVAVFGHAQPSIDSNDFERNSSLSEPYGQGGAIYVLNLLLNETITEISGNRFYRNSALDGGALLSWYGTPVIENNTLVFNSALGPGDVAAGLKTSGCSPTVSANIIALNSGGYGFAHESGGLPSLSCNDLFQNGLGPYSGVAPGAGDFALDPEFCDLSAGDLSLAAGSPCLPSSPQGCGLVGAFGQGCGAALGVNQEAPTAEVLRIRRLSPWIVEFQHTFDSTSPVSLEVFDLSGRLVFTTVFGADPVLRWDFRRQAKKHPAGILFARCKSKSRVATRPFTVGL